MRKYWFGIFIFSTLLMISQTAQARDYAIEMIIFEQVQGQITLDTESDVVEGEKWDFSNRKIADSLQRMATLESRSDDFQTQTTLDQLGQARHQLIQAGHRILRTASWVQPSAVYQHAPLISLSLVNTPLVRGLIRVYKTSLIYADIDLQFSPTGPADTALSGLSSSSSSSLSTPVTIRSQTDSHSYPPADDLPEHYFLSEKRRLKFREVHYLDHPKFGVILGIWPVSGN